MKSDAAAVDKQWMGILGDTPPKLEVDFSSGNVPHVSSVILDASTRTALETLCEEEGVSMFVFALGVMHHCLRAYSHEPYAIGTSNGEDNHHCFLIPFLGGKKGGDETLQCLNKRWVNDILPLLSLPHESFVKMDYGCSVCLEFNVGRDTSMPHLHTEESKLDLSIEWKEDDSGDGSIKVTFESGIGPWPGLEERFKQSISQVVAGNLAQSKPLSTLTTLLHHEEEQVLKFGTGPKDPIRNICLHEMFEEQVKNNLDAVALLNKSGTESMTYGELDKQANELALELQRLGAKPNTFVGILMGEKSFEMCVALLGVLKSGAAYVPMDALLFPPERIKFITEDTNMQLLVTTGEHANLVCGNFTTVLVEEVVARILNNPSTEDGHLECKVKPTDPAYIIYTSGTTGTPKGVVCSHIGPVNMIDFGGVFTIARPGVDSMGCGSPIVFDAFVNGFFGSLGSGIIFSLDMKCCTMLDCTPSMAEIFLEDETNNIMMLGVGGEACIQGLETKVSIFRNMYGPTECSIQATASDNSTTIGKPLPNVLCYIVHQDDGSLCPPGVSGELWIGGVGVSLGYHKRPELTDEKFIPNPFAPAGKVYKTGDRVKWDENGDIVFLGRFDHQVKVNGYRIELGEIQAELEKQANVSKGALVLVHDEKLVAFVASGLDDTSENEMLEDNLMAALKSEECSLTSYMVPWKIFVVNEFPLTLNGKIDRKELLARFDAMAASLLSDQYVAPATEEEVDMVSKWQAVLGTDQDIGMNDNFFDLGGHSVLAMILSAELKCDMRLILKHPTPSSLLEALDVESRAINIGSLDEITALTKSEQRMVFIQLNDPESTTYNIPFCIEFQADIDLKPNIHQVLDSLPILHTRFMDGIAIEDSVIDVQDVSPVNKEELKQLLYAPFDLSAGPLCRFGIDRKTNTLYGNIHHSIADGRSLQLLFEAIASGQVKHSSKEYSIRKYSAYEMLPQVQKEQKELVSECARILGDTPSRLEVDFASPNSNHVSSVILDAKTSTAIQLYCQREGISMFALALGIFHQCMRAYSHEPYAIGTAYDARPHEFRDTVGMFVNTVLIPFAKGKAGGEESMKHLNDRWVNDILPLAAAPFDMVSALGYGCNIWMAFNVGLLESANSAHKMRELPQYEELKLPKAKFDLFLEWIEAASGDGSIEVIFESGIGPWPGLEKRFKQIINQVVVGELAQSKSLSTLTTLLPHEEEQVLEWSQGEKKPISDKCLHELIEVQAQLRPDDVALYDESCTKSMTYGELDRQATGLAMELQRLGAKPNTFVGVLMGDRCFEMYVAILGILKSGAAYVPMHTVLFPPERIKFIAEDANMKILVTVREYEDFVSAEVITVLIEDVVVNEENKIPTNCRELKRNVKPNDIAYIIYTSGTTGKPKGVLCPHIMAVNTIQFDDLSILGKPGIDIVGCGAPLIFDVFVEGMFASLGIGLSLSLDVKCCTMLFCTPSLAEIYLEDETNTSVKYLEVAGEACIQGLEKRAPGFCNMYGPSETFLTVAGNKSTTIGRPLPNVLCYVVHPDDGNLCPPGVSGELWAGGIGVSLGYHNRPDLTAKKFIPDPFASTGKVYKTGDRVKWNEDGELVYLGRFDHQVKVNGYRIELGEIQAELEKQKGVNGALIIVHEKKLVAFVASGINDKTGNDVLEEDLMIALKSEECALTSYMVPWKILVVDEFPLTLNGKIDRKKLLADLQARMLSASVTASVNVAETPTQEFLCRLFEQILSVCSIGIDCDFFDRGGHSLLVMKAVMKIRQEYHIESFSVRQFIELKTVRKIAERIDEMTKGSKENEMSKSMTRSSLIGRSLKVFSSVVSNDEKAARLIMKVTGVIILFTTIWLCILPINMLMANAIIKRHKSFSGGRFGLYMAAVGILIAAFGVFFSLLAAFAWLYSILLRKMVGDCPTTIKRGTSTYAIWYVFDRLWFVVSMFVEPFLAATMFQAWLYRAFGAKLGRNLFFEEGVHVRMPFMLTCGDNVVVEVSANLETLVIKHNEDVAIDKLIIGDNVVVGPNTHIGLGSRIGNSSWIKCLSVVKRGRKIPENTTVVGENTSIEEPRDFSHVDDEPASLGWHFMYFFVSLIPSAILFLITTLAIYITSLHGKYLILFGIYPFVVTIAQVFVALCMQPLRKLLRRGQAKPMDSRLYSKSFLLVMLAKSLYRSSMKHIQQEDAESTIVSRLVTKYIYGADIDVHDSYLPLIEEPDLTKIGGNVFGANGVQLRNVEFTPGGFVHFGRVDVGDNAMILDRSVVSPGTVIEEKVMLGSLTSVTKETTHNTGCLLMGNPALNMIRMKGDVDMEIVAEPLSHSLLLFLFSIYSNFIVSMTIMMALYSNGIIFWWIVHHSVLSSRSAAIGISYVVFPALLIAMAVFLLSLCLVVKCIFVWNYKRFVLLGVLPVDSWASFRWLSSNILIHSLSPFPLQLIDEFWFTAMFWKIMGATIGTEVKIDADVLFLEVDVLEIGDNCRIEEEATLLCHKFNNGGMEISPIVLPSNTYIGARAVILPGSEIVDEFVSIGPLTPLNPGEKLTVGTWQGSPAEKIDKNRRSTCDTAV